MSETNPQHITPEHKRPVRSVFFISDRTGLTVESLGASLISQFEQFTFHQVTIPYVDAPETARAAVDRINQAYEKDGTRPLVFSTIVDSQIRTIVSQSKGFLLDFFATFINPLERELKASSSHTVGRAHGVNDPALYQGRINAVNFTLSHDDGARSDGYQQADIILVGLSRSGKTPTSLYLALQFGLLAANYPLTEDEVDNPHLPKILIPYRNKLFGLTIKAERLQEIRQQRYPNSSYASMKQCEHEVRQIENLFKKEQIPWIDTTFRSIEEISTKILAQTGIQRKR